MEENIDIQNDIVEQQNIEDKSLIENKENTDIKDVVRKEYQKTLNDLKSNKEFQKRVTEVVNVTSATTLRADLLKALTDEQKNELVQYQLQCEKEKLDYRKKHEKKVIYEEVKAEVQEKKINALKKRYAYLYDLDANGQPKKFIASKFVNKYKEICNWYDGTSQGFKKIVTSTLRIVFYVALAYVVYKGLIWASINLPNLIGNNGINP